MAPFYTAGLESKLPELNITQKNETITSCPASQTANQECQAKEAAKRQRK